jgi:hypothetical protein
VAGNVLSALTYCRHEKLLQGFEDGCGALTGANAHTNHTVALSTV